MFAQEGKVLMIEVSISEADILLEKFDCFSRGMDEFLVPDQCFIEGENEDFWKDFLSDHYPKKGLDEYSYISFYLQ